MTHLALRWQEGSLHLRRDHKEPAHLPELFSHHLMPHHLIYFLKIIFMNLRIKINDLKYQILVREIQTYLIAILR